MPCLLITDAIIHIHQTIYHFLLHPPSSALAPTALTSCCSLAWSEQLWPSSWASSCTYISCVLHLALSVCWGTSFSNFLCQDPWGKIKYIHICYVNIATYIYICCVCVCVCVCVGFPGSSRGKESTFQCRRHKRLKHRGLIPCRGQDNPLQYSCLENPMDRGAWGLLSMGSHRVGHDWSNLAAYI